MSSRTFNASEPEDLAAEPVQRAFVLEEGFAKLLAQHCAARGDAVLDWVHDALLDALDRDGDTPAEGA